MPDYLPYVPQPKKTSCKGCSISFYPKRSWQDFCSTKCRNDFHYKEVLAKRLLRKPKLLYIIHAPTSESEKMCYKVGISIDPAKRLKELQIGMPHKLHLVATFEIPTKSAYKIETKIHHMISYHRTQGEWFLMYKHALLDVIKTVLAEHGIS